MRVLVTGAAGFIGSHLAERLVGEDAEVVGIDSFTDYYPETHKRWNVSGLENEARFTLIEGDLTALDLTQLFSGLDTVFHLAGQPGVRTSWGSEFDTYVRDNVLATQRVLEAARTVGLPRLVYSSSSSIYGDAERYPTPEGARPRPMSPYGVSKLAGENLCDLYRTGYGVPVTILRYFTVYGPRQRPDMAIGRFIEAALARTPVTVYGDGGQSRDFTHVSDVVATTAAAGARGAPGATYNIAGGSQVTVLGLIDAISAALGTPIEIAHAPPSVGEPRHTGADTSAARSALGFVPSTDFEAGIASQVAAHRAWAFADA